MSKADVTLLVIVLIQVPFVIFDFGVISLIRIIRRGIS